jgi:hypothetical protein
MAVAAASTGAGEGDAAADGEAEGPGEGDGLVAPPSVGLSGANVANAGGGSFEELLQPMVLPAITSEAMTTSRPGPAPQRNEGTA